MQTQSAPSSTCVFGRNRAFLYGAVAIAIVAVVIAASAAVSFLRRQADLRAEFITQNFSRSMNLALEGMIDTIDVALLACADEIAREISTGKPDGHSITQVLMRQTERVPIVSYFRASNEGGDIIYGPGVLSPATNNADRDYFIRLRDDRKTGLLIVKPVVGRIAKKWVWSFARRINKPDGSFGGVVFAAILTDQIDEMLSQIKLGEADTISLRDTDRALIARYPPADSTRIPVGDKRLSTPFEEALKAHPQEGTYTSGATAINGVSRVHSYRHSAKYGFTVNVGVNVEESLAKWRNQLWFVSGLAGAFILASLLFTLVIGRAWRRQEQNIALLEASENRSRAIIEASPVPHALNDAQGKITYLNASFVRTFGYTLEDIRTLQEWWPKAYPEPVYREWVARAWQERMKQAERDNTEFVPLEVDIFCKDGKTRSVLAGATLIGTASEGIQLVTLFDLSDRKRSENLLKQSESRLRQMFENNASVMLLIEPQSGRILDANAAAARFYGYPLEQLRAMQIQQINTLAPEQVAAERSHALQEESNYFIFQHRIASGEIKTVEVRSTPIGMGEETLLFSIVSDITVRLQTERALLDQESRYRGIVDATIDGFWVLNSAGRILEVNDRYLERSGFSREELLGTSVFKIDAKQTSVEIDANLAKSGHQGTRIFETVHHTKDGKTWPVEISTIFRQEEGGRYYSFLRDITARKRLEEVRLQSQKMESLGTLAGGIAHDFNNIIATIMGNVDLARQDANANPLALESLEEIRKAGVRARDLVRQILAFSRREPLERKLTDLVPIVEESVRLLRATLPARIALELRCDGQVPAVLADATQIEQALINLATNAVQAMRGSPGHITVHLNTVMLDAALAATHPALHAMQEKHPGRTLRLLVSDDGPGMDAATLERVFEPFFTTKPPGEGTGLGLSVVPGMVQAHEGAIVVESQPGMGTSFAVYLPIADALVAPQEDPVENTPGTTPVLSLDGGQHILYLDDDESLVFLVRRLLERQGFRVSGYSNQNEALVALRAAPQAIDLVLTDYNMPGMSGLDVAREVRAIRADLPVAIASGFIDETLRAEAESAGIRELIFKADAVDEFCVVVQRLAQAVGAKPDSA